MGWGGLLVLWVGREENGIELWKGFCVGWGFEALLLVDGWIEIKGGLLLHVLLGGTKTWRSQYSHSLLLN
jgi:hypothetical protein